MKTLITFTTDKLSNEKFNPVKNRPLGWVKPDGGIWASTLLPLEENLSAWADWCIGENYALNKLCSCCVFKLNSSARIAEIDCFADLQKLIAKYRVNGFFEQKYLDFEKLSKDYDAIHLTDNGQWATRLTAPNLYGWDCESYLIMNPSVIYDLRGCPLPDKWWQKELKTLRTYYESDAKTWSEYAEPYDIVSDDIIDYFTNILPPITNTSRYLQAGGACDHIENSVTGKIEGTYLTFIKLAHNFNVYCGEHFEI